MLRYSTATIVVAILSTISCSAFTGNEGNKITVDVYYESLCPYSVRFIKDKLVPAYKDLKDFIEVNFVPFGKASYVIGNQTTFTCQHGPRECDGNREQACALYEIQRYVELKKQQTKSVEIVGCVMGRSTDVCALSECAEEAGLSKQFVNNIKSCMKSSVGDELLVACGEKTKAFESPLKGVPSVAINGVKNNKANSNFIREICKLIPDSQKPAICRQSLDTNKID